MALVIHVGLEAAIVVALGTELVSWMALGKVVDRVWSSSHHLTCTAGSSLYLTCTCTLSSVNYGWRTHPCGCVGRLSVSDRPCCRTVPCVTDEEEMQATGSCVEDVTTDVEFFAVQL